MKKIIIIVAVIIAVGVPAYYLINKRVINNKINEKLQLVISKDQGLTEMILRLANESITYGEVFEMCEKSVNSRTELLIELRGIYPDVQNKLRDSMAEFLSNENELIRIRSMASNRAMKLSTQLEYVKKLRENAGESYYYNEYYNKKADDEIDEMLKLKEEMSEYVKDFNNKYNSMTVRESILGNMMKAEGIRFVPIFAKYKEANIVKNVE